MSTMTYNQQIQLLEEAKQSANGIAAHAKAVSRSIARLDPLVSAMFRSTADDVDDLIATMEATIESIKAQRQMTLDHVFRTLIVVSDDDAPTWEDQFEVDQANLCDRDEELLYRVVGGEA